ncbi:MAG TPA: YdeI/OmpD-associated family protein [Candidatus Saccharimonadales bacterium]|nr:YdeI/OmpD-associated family protein [Candidatus Saccharimonadales bacterium]
MRAPTIDEVRIFPGPGEFRKWLETHHGSDSEVWVGYYKKGVAKPSITYLESVDQALCYGWIDGIGYRINDEVHAGRFTPRRRGSNWSVANIAKVAELEKAGLMQPAGRRAFEERVQDKDPQYSYENRPHDLPTEAATRMRANPEAWRYWQAQTASYRRAATWWMVSAKQEATRERRLMTLIDDSAAHRPIKLLLPRPRDRS